MQLICLLTWGEFSLWSAPYFWPCQLLGWSGSLLVSSKIFGLLNFSGCRFSFWGRPTALPLYPLAGEVGILGQEFSNSWERRNYVILIARLRKCLLKLGFGAKDVSWPKTLIGFGRSMSRYLSRTCWVLCVVISTGCMLHLIIPTGLA